MAQQYAAKGLIAPINVLWMYHFVAGNDDEAQKIFDEYLKKEPAILSKHILMTAKEKQDYNLAKKLVTVVSTSGISDVAKGAIYSGLIDIYSACGMFDEALSTIEQAEKSIGIAHIYEHCFRRVDAGLNAMGRASPYGRRYLSKNKIE